MKELQENETIIIYQELETITQLVEHLDTPTSNYNSYNIIVKLNDEIKEPPLPLKLFIPLSTKKKKQKKSFVIVSKEANLENLPNNLNIAPTLQEAKDIIEFETMERDLGF